MAPFKALYGRRCHTPLNSIEPGEKVIFRPDLVEEAEATVRCIQGNLKVTKSRQETYANKRHQPLEFEVGDHVYLRVSPMKCLKRFRVKGKLVHRYIGPFPSSRSVGLWLPCVTTKEVSESTHGCRVAWSDTARGWLIVPRVPNQSLGLEGSCHEA
jgi:hypothetical protein